LLEESSRALLIIVIMARRVVTMLFLCPSSTFGFSFDTDVKIITPTTTEMPKSFLQRLRNRRSVQPSRNVSLLYSHYKRISYLFRISGIMSEMSFDKIRRFISCRGQRESTTYRLNCSSPRFLNSHPPRDHQFDGC